MDITVLTDNYTDVLQRQGSDDVRRLMVPPPRVPRAEHGLSCLITVRSGAERHTVLMDMGDIDLKGKILSGSSSAAEDLFVTRPSTGPESQKFECLFCRLPVEVLFPGVCFLF